ADKRMNTKLTVYFLIAILGALAPPPGRAQSREQSLTARFDKDGDKKLNAAERKAALDAIGRNSFRRPLSEGFLRQAGVKITPASVRNVPETVPFYDLGTLRTLFFEFEDENWEMELMAFKETDIEVPATLTVDGKTFKDVGVQFRGNSSFSMVPA